MGSWFQADKILITCAQAQLWELGEASQKMRRGKLMSFFLNSFFWSANFPPPRTSEPGILHQGEFRFLLAFSTHIYQTDIIEKWNDKDLTTTKKRMEPTLRLSRSLSSLNPWFSVLTCSKSPSVLRSFAFRLSLSLVTAWSSYKIAIETTFVMDMLTWKKSPDWSWLWFERLKKTKRKTEAFVMWPQWTKYPLRVNSCIHSKNQLVWHNFSYTYKVWT